MILNSTKQSDHILPAWEEEIHAKRNQLFQNNYKVLLAVNQKSVSLLYAKEGGLFFGEKSNEKV